MSRQRVGQGGSRWSAPIKTIWRPATSSGGDVRDDALYTGIMWEYCWHEDFCGDLSAADIGIEGTIYDLSPTGTPTASLLANAAFGQLKLQLTNNNQQEVVGYYWGDQRQIPGNCRFLYKTRFQVSGCTTAQRFQFGLIGAFSTHETAWDDITRFARFRLEAGLDLYCEVNDGTTSTTRQTGASIQTLTANTWYNAEIEKQADGKIQFRLMDDYGLNLRTVTEISAGVLDSTTMQPVFMEMKDSGTGTPSCLVDYLKVMAIREGG